MITPEQNLSTVVFDVYERIYGKELLPSRDDYDRVQRHVIRNLELTWRKEFGGNFSEDTKARGVVNPVWGRI